MALIQTMLRRVRALGWPSVISCRPHGPLAPGILSTFPEVEAEAQGGHMSWGGAAQSRHPDVRGSGYWALHSGCDEGRTPGGGGMEPMGH